MILKLSAAWSNKVIDCTTNGIVNGCKGRCCKGFLFYPSRSNIIQGVPVGKCFYLGINGCVLSDNDKPIKCLLYPYVIKNGNLGLHGRALLGICKENYRKGNIPIIEVQRHNLSLLFGEETVSRMVQVSLKERRDFPFRTSATFDAAFDFEQEEEKENTVPLPRSKYWRDITERMLL